MKNILLKGGTALLDAVSIAERLEIKPNYVVADLGCGGAGHFVVPLSRMVGPGGTVYALDIQKTVLAAVTSKTALMHCTNVHTIWSDLESYGAAPIATESCDRVLIINVLFQNNDHAAIIKEGARLLREGGQLAVIEWKPLASPFGPPADHRLSPQTVKKLATDLGLALYDEFDGGKYHFVEVFRK